MWTLRKRVSAAQSHRQPPNRAGSALRSLLFFSVGFFQQRFGNYCPTSTWWTGSGTHSTGKHSFFWQLTTPVGEAAIVTPAWQSMLHTKSLTRTFAFILSASPLCLSYFVSPPLFCPFTTSWWEKWGNVKREREKKKWSVNSESPLLSVSLLLFPHHQHPPSLPQSSCFLAPVSGMSLPCLRGVSAPLAKPIDPLITCGSTIFSEEQVCACTFHTHFK